jgi:hypothetical protein
MINISINSKKSDSLHIVLYPLPYAFRTLVTEAFFDLRNVVKVVSEIAFACAIHNYLNEYYQKSRLKDR